MPDVRRYLSVFWGVLVMLIKLFDYLSDGRTPLVDDLGDVSVFKNTLLGFPTWTLKIKAKLLKNGGILPFLKYFFDHKCILKLRIYTRALLMLLKLNC